MNEINQLICCVEVQLSGRNVRHILADMQCSGVTIIRHLKIPYIGWNIWEKKAPYNKNGLL